MNSLLDFDEPALSRAGGLWTAREIVQQPASWRRTQELLQRQAAKISGFLAPLLANPDIRIILTGAGSSAFIGECLAPVLLGRLGRRVEAIATTDLLSGPELFFQETVPTLLVSFGRSGNSPESIAVVELADRLLRDCHQLVITCNEQGALYQRCGERDNSLAILLPAETHDQSFAMTSSFTSMMLATSLAFQTAGRGGLHVGAIANAAQALLGAHNAALRTLAGYGYSRVVFLGSNGLKGLAREAALKLLELTDGKVVAAFDSPLGFRHGPKTIVNGDTLLFVFVSNDAYTRRYDLDLLRELRSDGLAARVIAITARLGDAVADGEYLHLGELEGADDEALCYPYIVCAQLFAFHRALVLGNRPDQPNDAGTVSRVVRGVTIHSL